MSTWVVSVSQAVAAAAALASVILVTYSTQADRAQRSLEASQRRFDFELSQPMREEVGRLVSRVAEQSDSAIEKWAISGGPFDEVRDRHIKVLEAQHYRAAAHMRFLALAYGHIPTVMSLAASMDKALDAFSENAYRATTSAQYSTAVQKYGVNLGQMCADLVSKGRPF